MPSAFVRWRLAPAAWWSAFAWGPARQVRLPGGSHTAVGTVAAASLGAPVYASRDVPDLRAQSTRPKLRRATPLHTGGGPPSVRRAGSPPSAQRAQPPQVVAPAAWSLAVSLSCCKRRLLVPCVHAESHAWWSMRPNRSALEPLDRTSTRWPSTLMPASASSTTSPIKHHVLAGSSMPGEAAAGASSSPVSRQARAPWVTCWRLQPFIYILPKRVALDVQASCTGTVDTHR